MKWPELSPTLSRNSNHGVSSCRSDSTVPSDFLLQHKVHHTPSQALSSTFIAEQITALHGHVLVDVRICDGCCRKLVHCFLTRTFVR